MQTRLDSFVVVEVFQHGQVVPMGFHEFQRQRYLNLDKRNFKNRKNLNNTDHVKFKVSAVDGPRVT
jgi:hypothetical protein